MTSRKMHKDEIKRFRVTFQSANRLFESRWAFSNSFFLIFFMSPLFAGGSIHQGLDTNGSGNESRGRLAEICMYLATVFADSHINAGAKILVRSSVMEIFCVFSLCIQQE